MAADGAMFTGVLVSVAEWSFEPRLLAEGDRSELHDTRSRIAPNSKHLSIAIPPALIMRKIGLGQLRSQPLCPQWVESRHSAECP